MYIYHIHVCMCIHLPTENKGQCWPSTSIIFPLCFWKRPFSKPTAHQFDQPTVSEDQGYAFLCISPPTLHPPVTWVLGVFIITQASSLRTKPSPQLCGRKASVGIKSWAGIEGYSSPWFWPVVTASWWSAAMWRPTDPSQTPLTPQMHH